jgi:hypothetical protein
MRETSGNGTGIQLEPCLLKVDISVSEGLALHVYLFCITEPIERHCCKTGVESGSLEGVIINVMSLPFFFPSWSTESD